MNKAIFAGLLMLALAGCDEATMGGSGGASAATEAPMGEPVVSTLTVGGKTYTVRQIANDRVPVVNLIGTVEVQADGTERIIPPAPGGIRIVNSVRVAGAVGLVEAAGVMLRVCGKNPSQAPLWAPEPVPYLSDTGEFVFSNVC